MSSKIQTISGTEITPEGGRTDVIKALEEVLAMAIRGEVAGVGIATITPGGTSLTKARWGTGFGLAMLGSATLLVKDISDGLDSCSP